MAFLDTLGRRQPCLIAQAFPEGFRDWLARFDAVDGVCETQSHRFAHQWIQEARAGVFQHVIEGQQVVRHPIQGGAHFSEVGGDACHRFSLDALITSPPEP